MPMPSKSRRQRGGSIVSVFLVFDRIYELIVRRNAHKPTTLLELLIGFGRAVTCQCHNFCWSHTPAFLAARAVFSIRFPAYHSPSFDAGHCQPRTIIR